MSGLIMGNIRHAFGKTEILKNISLVAEAGKLTCLLGPSGCGKTTLLRLAAGLETIQDGCIELRGEMVADSTTGLCLAPEKRGIGLMFQDYALFPHLNVFDNIAFGLPELTDERREWIEKSLHRLGIAKHRNSFPHVLSGGQQQRVALLRALAPEPKVLLLDEPFSGLDVTRRAQIREETLTFLKDCNVAVLMVTHDPDEAMFMADHIVIMKNGKIVQAGTPVQIYFHPATAFVAELFGELNEFEGVVKNGQVDTPLGAYSIPSVPDDHKAKVLVRMEGIQLSMGHNKAAQKDKHLTFGHIHEVYLLGRSSHLHVHVPGPDHQDEVILHVRVPGVLKPEFEAAVTVWTDEKQVFVFGVDESKT